MYTCLMAHSFSSLLAGGCGAGDFLPLDLAAVGEAEGDGGGGGVRGGVPEKPGPLTREIFSLGLLDGGNSLFFGPPCSSALRRPVASHSEISSSPAGGGGKPSLVPSLW